MAQPLPGHVRPEESPGADLAIRKVRDCAGCGRRRLTTETNIGPCCNDCLAGGVPIERMPDAGPERREAP